LERGAGSRLRGFDDVRSFREFDGDVLSVVAVVQAFHRGGKDPGPGEEQLGADEGLWQLRGCVRELAEVGCGVTKVDRLLVRVQSGEQTRRSEAYGL